MTKSLLLTSSRVRLSWVFIHRVVQNCYRPAGSLLAIMWEGGEHQLSWFSDCALGDQRLRLYFVSTLRMSHWGSSISHIDWNPLSRSTEIGPLRRRHDMSQGTSIINTGGPPRKAHGTCFSSLVVASRLSVSDLTGRQGTVIFWLDFFFPPVRFLTMYL